LRDQILLYLFLRPEKVLSPVKAVEHKHLFYYPILEQFKYAYQDPQTILEEMVSQGLLKKTELLHRLRLCPKCSSPHMQLREECPRCKSIEIDQKPFIHCFGCGQVSPQDDFFTEHGMTCPKCQLKLRQIGVDYDRPLEEGHCSSCEHVFSEPEIKSVCLSCEHQDDPSSWRIGNVHKLILSQPGQMAVRMGGAEQLFTMHEEANLISMPFFRHFLTWSIRLVQRHRSLPFSVVLVQIANTQELYENIGHAATHRALDDFAVRFQSTLRTTDIMSRPETDRFWGLLPHTDQSGCETVVERLAELGNGQNGEKLLGVNCVSLSLPDDLIHGEKTDGFITRMLGLASAK
jgi:GGDEF domain-containing protein